MKLPAICFGCHTLKVAAHCAFALMLAGAEGVRSATLKNGGFETGDFSGWNISAPLYPEYYDWDPETPRGFTPDGTLTIVDDAVHAAEGSHYFEIRGRDALWRHSGSDRHVTLTQPVWMHANEVLSGFVAWDSEDYMAFDTGWVRIYQNGSLVATPWFERTYQYPSNPRPEYPVAWTQWTFVAPSGGPYELELGIGNSDDGLFYQMAFFDGITATQISDTASVLPMLIVGLAGIWAVSALPRRCART